MMRRTNCAGAAALAAASGAAAFVLAPSTPGTGLGAPRATASAAQSQPAAAAVTPALCAAAAVPTAAVLVAAAAGGRRRRASTSYVRVALRAAEEATKEAPAKAPAEAAEGAPAAAKDMPLADMPASLQAAAARAAAGTQIRGPKAAATGVATFDATTQAGVTEPLGFFDPLGFCPPDDEVKFRKLRISEMKHGRIAMLASVGLVAQHYIRLPGGAFDEVPNGVYALSNPSGGFGMAVLVWICLVFEFVVWAQDPAKEVGDFGDPLNVGMGNREMRNRELNNGRAAMFATIGILIAELATGKDSIEQLGLP
mmetsp:Transcript_9326/g.24055  ORF Transcript_9326/g.24055 Transcript_9326/m.24055 type:complete len:311 (+) Transcript_9326:86-1018(+)